jgi:hypothetical protein
MDTMDFLKRAWSSFNVPTPFAPTLDVDELDKRIADLRAVEQWLALNQSMLRNTIQGLEIQRGTLGAINAMSDSFGKALRPSDDTIAQTLAQFAAAAAARQASDAAAEPPPAPGIHPTPGMAFGWSPSSMPSSAAFAPGASRAAGGDQAGGAGPSVDPLAGAGVNPLAWWNLLQSNFQQIAQAATGHSGAEDPSQGHPRKSGSKPARKAKPAPAGKAGRKVAGMESAAPPLRAKSKGP